MNPLMRLLSLAGDDTVAREVRLARVEVARSALAALGDGDTSDGGGLLRRKLEAHLQRVERAVSDPNRVEEELDWAELNTEGMARSSER